MAFITRFIPPSPPKEDSDELRSELERLSKDDPDLIFRHEGGGFKKLGKIFNGQLQQVLESFNESIWQQTAA